MTKVAQNFEAWANEDINLRFTITGSDGSTGEDLSGCSVRWVMQDEIDSACWLVNKITSSGVTISTSTVNVAVAASDLSGLAGTYYHELKLTTSGSSSVLAIGTGKINRSSG